MSTTISNLSSVFQEVFNDDEITLSSQTSAADIEGWDSLTHVTLILRVEKAFGIRFSSTQVASLKNVGDLVALIDSKLAAK
jgi:acyl carrier protein